MNRLSGVRPMVAFVMVVLAGLAASCPSKVSAYGATGHQIIGAIADRMLSKDAKQQVDDLIGTSLQAAGPWGDCARSVMISPNMDPNGDAQYAHYAPSVDYSGPCLFFESQEGRGRMESYVRDNWIKCGPGNGEAGCPRLFHFADIAIERDAYATGEAGATNEDIVHAINAAIAVLQGKASPEPFVICDKAEAILMLAHFVGDIHQPLHVGAVYLKDNQEFDPDKAGGLPPAETLTQGGNYIFDPTGNTDLHTEWDAVDPTLNPSHLTPSMLAEAKSVSVTSGSIELWPAQWATETLQGAKRAYANLHYTKGTKKPWDVHFDRDNRDAYMSMKVELQAHELARAGARLAQILNATLGTRPAEQTQLGYLSITELHASKKWLPKRPSDDSPVVTADTMTFLATRSYYGTERWNTAKDDDVYLPIEKVTARFQKQTGKVLNADTAPTLTMLLGKVQKDQEALLEPLKKNVCAGGRHRPIYEYPQLNFCPVDAYPTLKLTGSYPSGHATMGWLWAGVLTELMPEKSSDILARGLDFGESRVVCGFHYPSDIEAGRIAGAGLLDRLHADAAFKTDMACAAQEVKLAPAADTVVSKPNLPECDTKKVDKIKSAKPKH